MAQKVVLITGASSGIGKAIAEFLQQKHFIVYGTSRNPERNPESKIQLIKLEVTDTASIQRAVEEVIHREGRINVLINNAGIGITGALEEMPTAEMKRNFDTNLFGPIELIKAVLPHMRQQGAGLIINITSIAGYMGLPFRSIYSASKGALELTTEALRMEVKPFGIEVTNIAPGDFATNIAQGRYHAPLLEDSAYHKAYKETLNLMDSHVDAGNNPLEMAKAVYKVINTPRPKVHYKVGSFLQKFSILLKRILPDKVYENILMNHYKLKK